MRTALCGDDGVCACLAFSAIRMLTIIGHGALHLLSSGQTSAHLNIFGTCSYSLRTKVMDFENSLEAFLTLLETWAPAETEGELVQARIDWLDEVCSLIQTG